MKNFLKAMFLVVCTIFAVSIIPTTVSAAAKINKSEISITKGKSYTLKVNGTSKKKTWKTFDSSIAKVTSKGKVTGKSVGSTVVYAKVGSKYYYCVVNVMEKYKKSIAEKNVSCTTIKIKEKYEQYELAYITNKNSYPVDISMQLLLYNSKNEVISIITEDFVCIPANSNAAYICSIPQKSNFDYISYSKCKAIYDVSKTDIAYNTDLSSKLSISSNKGVDGIILNAKNNGKKAISYLNVGVVFYDSNKKIVGYSDFNLSSLSAGKLKYVTAGFPEKKFSTYRIVINQACS